MFSSQASTQDFHETQDDHLGNESTHEDSWGRLLSVRSQASVIELCDSVNEFGRGEEILSKHRFTPEIYGDSFCGAISKLHFKLTKGEKTDSVVILEDLSSNGTYVNQNLIGRKNKIILQSNDDIALADPKKKVFVFYDCLNNDSDEYPAKLREKYTVSKAIGTGSYGEVRLAYCQGTLKKCAVKILKKSMSRDGNLLKLNNVSQIKNEVNLLCSLDHPCIVKLLDMIESPDKIYMVMELAEGGELFDRITGNPGLSESDIKLYMYQLLHAIKYLHSNRITHRDLKPENILLSSDDVITCVKLTDFGLSKIAVDTSQMHTFCGTPTYIPPELLRYEVYSNKVDMWSLGVVMFVSLAAYSPFLTNDDVILRKKIQTADFNYKNKIWENVSLNMKDLIKKLIVVNPDNRLGAEEALNHPWFDDTGIKETADRLMMPAAVPISRKRNRCDEQNTMVAKTPKLTHNIPITDYAS